MLTDVRMAFDKMVSELDWMDAGTRARAHRKLHAMRPFVGFPEWITKPDKLDKFYKGVSLSLSLSPELNGARNCTPSFSRDISVFVYFLGGG